MRELTHAPVLFQNRGTLMTVPMVEFPPDGSSFDTRNACGNRGLLALFSSCFLRTRAEFRNSPRG